MNATMISGVQLTTLHHLQVDDMETFFTAMKHGTDEITWKDVREVSMALARWSM